jgi:Zn-dependent protease/CBS domain-containing protein
MKAFGVRIGVSPFFFLILFLLIFSLNGYYADLYPDDDTKSYVLAVVAGLLFPASILAHELGHALVAKRNDIKVGGIELWLLGGLARMQPARTAGAEFRVAAAGPAVSLVLVVVAVALGMTVLDSDQFWAAASLEYRTDMGAAEAVLGYITGVNLLVFAFNLIPGLPLDGGRMALAVAWWRTGDRAKATKIAATLGMYAAYALGGIGLWMLFAYDGVWGIWLILIAFFMGQSARAEQYWSQKVHSPLKGLTVQDVMDAQPVAVNNGLKLDAALDEFFWRYRWPWFPVTDNNGQFVGLVELDKVEAVPEALRPGSTVDSVMARDADSFQVRTDDPVETLLGAEALHRFGALMAVDADGVLRGVVTIDQVRRALRPTPAVDTHA